MAHIKDQKDFGSLKFKTKKSERKISVALNTWFEESAQKIWTTTYLNTFRTENVQKEGVHPFAKIIKAIADEEK